MWHKVINFVVAILITQAAGLISSLFTVAKINTWYLRLNKPDFHPPNEIFSPVWITLYFIMGVSLFLIFNHGMKGKEFKLAITFFAWQLALNAIWAVLFFGMKSPLWAFIDIIILWFMIGATIFEFYKISKPAGILLIPYWLWVSFAAILNYYILILN